MLKNRYSLKEVQKMLLATVVFANANQGLTKVAGETYGEQVNHIIATSNEERETVNIVARLRS